MQDAKEQSAKGGSGAEPRLGGASDRQHAADGLDVWELASALGPALATACEGRLTSLEWFRATWQAGGAGTGFAKYRRDDGSFADVVVKLPVGYREYWWTTSLANGVANGDGARVTPRVFASGLEVGGHDLAWLVVERLPGHPLSHDLDERGVRDLLAAAVDLSQHACAAKPIEDPPPPPDWRAHLDRARHNVREQEVPDGQRWNETVKHVQRALPRLMEQWVRRPINTWCHGDLHPGNAMRRAGESGCVLIDLALMHAGHWVEDAVYLERLYWGRTEQLHGVKPVSVMARTLRERHLLGTEDYARLANIRRVLMGATSPAFLNREGHPRYLRAALETVERILPLIYH